MNVGMPSQSRAIADGACHVLVWREDVFAAVNQTSPERLSHSG